MENNKINNQTPHKKLDGEKGQLMGLPKIHPASALFNLSDKMLSAFGKGETDCYFNKKDVKEFIRLLKKKLTDGDYYGDKSFTNLFKEIDSLAGDKLK